MNPYLLVVSYHEIGHGLYYATNGIHVDKCTVWEPLFGGGARGRTHVTQEETPELQAPHAVGLFAGGVAELRAWRELTDHSPGDIARAVEASTEGDMAAWRRARKRCPLSEGEARSQAEAWVDKHWRQIGKLAQELVKNKRLPGKKLRI